MEAAYPRDRIRILGKTLALVAPELALAVPPTLTISFTQFGGFLTSFLTGTAFLSMKMKMPYSLAALEGPQPAAFVGFYRLYQLLSVLSVLRPACLFTESSAWAARVQHATVSQEAVYSQGYCALPSLMSNRFPQFVPFHGPECPLLKLSLHSPAREQHADVSRSTSFTCHRRVCQPAFQVGGVVRSPHSQRLPLRAAAGLLTFRCSHSSTVASSA